MPEILVDKSTAEAIVQWSVSRNIRHSSDMPLVAPGIVAINLAPFDAVALQRYKRRNENFDDAVLRLLKETNHSKAYAG